jgi:hypothetical protein
MGSVPANGDTVTDFAGNGGAAGDSLVFAGFGVSATFNQLNATQWQILYNAGASQEIINFSNSAAIDPSDYSFL